MLEQPNTLVPSLLSEDSAVRHAFLQISGVKSGGTPDITNTKQP